MHIAKIARSPPRAGIRPGDRRPNIWPAKWVVEIALQVEQEGFAAACREEP
jgi:hypothetical protein